MSILNLQHRPSVALRTLWQLCLLVPEVGCPRSPAGLPKSCRLPSVRRSFSVTDGTCDRPPTLPPDMVIQGVQVGWIWRPLVFGYEIWAVGTSCVCWRAVLLEDVSTGQSKFINKELAVLLFTNSTSTDDVINGKLVTGYFESLKEFWTIFVHRFSYKVFERAEIARCQHCNADNFKLL